MLRKSTEERLVMYHSTPVVGRLWAKSVFPVAVFEYTGRPPILYVGTGHGVTLRTRGDGGGRRGEHVEIHGEQIEGGGESLERYMYHLEVHSS